jgi:diguanylate cyclase (GGDEF)-like protein/PAS domain S-box-containing protein
VFDKQKHQQLKSALEAIGACVAIFEKTVTDNFRFVSANSLFEELTISSIDTVIEKSISDIFPRYLANEFTQSLSDCIAKHESCESEIVVDFAGQVRWWRLICSPIIHEHNQLNRVLVTAIEITEKRALRKELETSKRRFEAVVEAAYDGIITIDDNQIIRQANRSAKEMFLLDDKIINNLKIDYLVPKKVRSNHESYVSGFRNSPVKSRPMHMRASVTGLRTDGSEFPAEITISKITVDGNIEMTAIIRDISERASLIEDLQRAATQDPLTGCYNRRFLHTLLSNELERSNRFNHNMAIAMIDLDNFKTINDNFGHEEGDNALLKLVKLINSVKRVTDTYCRWGGDEFLLLIPETSSEEAKQAVERIRQSLCKVVVGDNTPIQCSIGISVLSKPNESVDDIISRADEALFLAKEAGRNQVKVL